MDDDVETVVDFTTDSESGQAKLKVQFTPVVSFGLIYSLDQESVYTLGGADIYSRR